MIGWQKTILSSIIIISGTVVAIGTNNIHDTLAFVCLACFILWFID